MEPEDAQESCRSNNIDADKIQMSAEDALDEESVSIAVENLIQKLMQENRSLKKELASLKEVKAVNFEDYRDVKEQVNARQCTTSKGFEITGRNNTETKCDINFLQKSMIENADHIKPSKMNDSTGDRENLRINCISLNSGMKNADQNSWKSCRYCDEIHKWGSKYCSAYGRVCRKCGKQNHIAKVCRSSKRRTMTYYPDVNMAFLVNKMGQRGRILLYNDYGNYNIFPCKRNPSAKDVVECLRKFNNSHELPRKVCLRYQHDASEMFYKELAASLKCNNLYVEVIKDQRLNTTVKQIMDIEVRNELIKTGKENKLLIDKMEKQIRNMDMRIFNLENDKELTEKHRECDEKSRMSSDEEDILELYTDTISDSGRKRVEQRYIDFANAILPHSTKEISDLRTGKVWLHLLNRMYKQNYKHSNPRKNYNNCLKILQANDVDGEFILNDWNEILKGNQKENIFVADHLRNLLWETEDCEEICDEIEETFDKIQEEKKKQRGIKKEYIVESEENQKEVYLCSNKEMLGKMEEPVFYEGCWQDYAKMNQTQRNLYNDNLYKEEMRKAQSQTKGKARTHQRRCNRRI